MICLRPYGESVAVRGMEPKFSGVKLMQLITMYLSAESYSAKEALGIDFLFQSLNSNGKFTISSTERWVSHQ